MPKTTPVAYAEQTLGVHEVEKEAKDATEAMDEALDDRQAASTVIREIREEMAERESDLGIEERAENPEMSATAFHQHMKTVVQKDDRMRTLRGNLMEEQARYEEADARVTQYTTRVRIATSRMIELGGYLHYLAAAKQASLVSSEE